MNISFNKEVKNYWYLDEKGIISLVAQCSDYFEEEKASQQSSSNERKTGIHLAIKALAAIFGSASVETNVQQNIANYDKQSLKLTKKVEQHLYQVIGYLEKHRQLLLYDNIEQFVEITEDKLPLFCMASLGFYLDKEYYLENVEPYSLLLPNYQLANKVGALIEKEKFVKFKADLTNKLLPSHKWQRVVLGASLEKWTAVRTDNSGHPVLGRTSHLGIILKESVWSPININFLGHVTKMGTSLYIKPYAIWDLG